MRLCVYFKTVTHASRISLDIALYLNKKKYNILKTIQGTGTQDLLNTSQTLLSLCHVVMETIEHTKKNTGYSFLLNMVD